MKIYKAIIETTDNSIVWFYFTKYSYKINYFGLKFYNKFEKETRIYFLKDIKSLKIQFVGRGGRE